MHSLLSVASNARLVINNNGAAIAATNYWNTSLSSSGAFYLSVNAGALRLLVPRSHEHILSEMRAANQVLVSRGPWPAARSKDAIELLWEDGSTAPYTIHLEGRSVDRLTVLGDMPRVVDFHAYTRGFQDAPLLAGQWPARCRAVRMLPYLKPWGR